MNKRRATVLFFVALGAAATIGLTSCGKFHTYCASCYEYYSGYTAPDFCGTESQVDAYISELEITGASVGQSWSCTKFRE
jgi:hypothetical protein